MAAMTTDPEIQEVSQLSDDLFDVLTTLIIWQVTDEEAKEIEEGKTSSDQKQSSEEGEPRPPKSSATNETTDAQKVKPVVCVCRE